MFTSPFARLISATVILSEAKGLCNFVEPTMHKSEMFRFAQHDRLDERLIIWRLDVETC
jgi:hypothetical protein